jgi:hypothetical protein
MTSHAVRTIATKLGLKTADQAPRPAPKPSAAEPARTRDRRLPEWWKAFRDLTPAAVYVCGHDAPVPRSFADNRGVWPIKIGITTRWEPLDTLSKEMDRHHAVHWMGMWFRVWTLSGEDAGSLAFLVANAIAAEPAGTQGYPDPVSQLHQEIVRWVRADKLRKGFVDIGSDFDLPAIDGDGIRKRLKMPAPTDQEQHRTQYYEVIRNKLELAVHQLAGDYCIQAWDDEGFAAHVDGLVMRNARRQSCRFRAKP